jgi:hypothetical protein
MTLRGLGDDTSFASMTADQQAAWLLGQTAAQTGSVAFSDMTADQQLAFLNQSGFNALTPAQQSALLNTLNPATPATTTWITGVPNGVVIAGGLILLVFLMERGR